MEARGQAAIAVLAGLPVLDFVDAKALEAWLARQASDSPGAWIRFAKKTAAGVALTKAQAIDAALCHGWIDGRMEKYDKEHWLVRFTPRKPRSNWSANNRKRALELIAEGRMRPAGLAQVEAAKADGRWDNAYAPASRAEVPDDLRQALDKVPEAGAFFASLDSRNRYAILYRISIVKRAETRSRKIAEFVAMLARGQKIHR
ncbi:YdeI/OmpD-associated family protein [Candidimonas nitroreducens]|uniref:Bacteriocin-protection protein n=1 Tax=Candidimonas nitroreducens TaxID=683354 RepID=A0A225M630_9BURK|nr:YdeI/OmpD-associated family protein [Candidimonas nitroreducens]OWT56738.1 hypothetical protein CEY11_17695 [Candidimonas nitroreducens]